MWELLSLYNLAAESRDGGVAVEVAVEVAGSANLVHQIQAVSACLVIKYEIKYEMDCVNWVSWLYFLIVIVEYWKQMHSF